MGYRREHGTVAEHNSHIYMQTYNAQNGDMKRENDSVLRHNYKQSSPLMLSTGIALKKVSSGDKTDFFLMKTYKDIYFQLLDLITLL